MIKYLLVSLLLFLTFGVKAQYYEGRVGLDSGSCHYSFQISDKTPRAKRNIIYYWYKAGKIHHSQDGYDGKILNGDYSVTSLEQHNLVEKGRFVKGKKRGVWKTWYPNQVLKSIVFYHWYNRTQAIKEFDNTGRLVEKGRYKHQLFTGRKYTYFNDSLTTAYYKKGMVRSPKNKNQRAQRAQETTTN